jgi:hypothetical protein
MYVAVEFRSLVGEESALASAPGKNVHAVYISRLKVHREEVARFVCVHLRACLEEAGEDGRLSVCRRRELGTHGFIT